MSLEEAHAQLAPVVDQGDPLSYLEAQAKIAEGSSGNVYLANDKRERRRVAIKRIDLKRARRRELLLNELLVLRHFKHEHMMALYAAHVRNDELWLVLEYLDAGTLTDIIQSHA